MRPPEPPYDPTLALASAKAELLRLEVEMARLQPIEPLPVDEPFLHDLSPLGQHTLGAV